jgi:hypothetical protein
VFSDETEHSGGPPFKLPTKISTFSGTGKAIPSSVFAFRRIRSDPFTFTFVHAMGGGVDVANAAAPDASITPVPFESFVICRYSNTL